MFLREMYAEKEMKIHCSENSTEKNKFVEMKNGEINEII